MRLWRRRRCQFLTRRTIQHSLSILTILTILWQIKHMYSLMTMAETPTQKVRNSGIASSGSMIVMTSTSLLNEQIKRISQTEGWNLLIVADKIRSNDWRKFNVTILDKDVQHKLGYRVLKYLPSNSYTRKIIGYLYAIEHGAEFIYDYDLDDNFSNNPIDFPKDFVFGPVTRGLILNIYADNVIANPYSHFGQDSVWPRGFPREYKGQSFNNTYIVCRMVTPLIQQGIMNSDLNQGANRDRTRNHQTRIKSSRIKFDSSAPPVIFPKGVLGPFNSENTIFHYDAFWAMVLPVSVEFGASDIWRGYWAQPLLWSIGRYLGFYSASTTQTGNINPDSYLRNFGEKNHMYKKIGAVVDFLANWECLSQDLYKCMLELTSTLVDHRMWSFVEIKLMEAWIHDLESIGYKPPPFRRQYRENSSPCLNEKEKTFAVFKAVQMQSNDVVTAYQDEFRIPLRKFCNFIIPVNLKVDPDPAFIFPSTLLVVTFNNPHYEVIWLLDIIYRPHYPNILYCGSLQNVAKIYDLLANKTFSEANVKKFSFVHADVGRADYVYECALRAIDMNYNVTGYAMVSDDILFNFWNNGRLNPEEPWIFRSFNTLNTDLPPDPPWWRWGEFYGHNATVNALNEIYNVSSKVNIHVKQFVRNREMYGYNSSIAMRSGVDIYYFPASKQDIVYEVGSILRKHNVYLEISGATILTGLSPPSNLVFMSGLSVWDNNRKIPFKFFNASHSVLHPVKPSQVINDLNLTKSYCQHYVARILQL